MHLSTALQHFSTLQVPFRGGCTVFANGLCQMSTSDQTIPCCCMHSVYKSFITYTEADAVSPNHTLFRGLTAETINNPKTPLCKQHHTSLMRHPATVLQKRAHPPCHRVLVQLSSTPSRAAKQVLQQQPLAGSKLACPHLLTDQYSVPSCCRHNGHHEGSPTSEHSRS